MKFSRYRSLSRARLWMRDFLHFASKVPTAGGTGVVNLSGIAAARRACRPLISWTAIFIKAGALAAKKQPVLRQCYMPFPWPHIYEHPRCVTNMIIEREWRNENVVFADLIEEPENKSLREIDRQIQAAKRKRIEGHRRFHTLIEGTRYPLPIRRLFWRIVLYVSGRLRMEAIGTASINSMRSRSAQVTQSFTLHTFSFVVTPPGKDGDMTVQVFVDHRLIDGVMVVRVLREIELALHDQILNELRQEAVSSAPEEILRLA
jgi:hypothetical protein